MGVLKRRVSSSRGLGGVLREQRAKLYIIKRCVIRRRKPAWVLLARGYERGNWFEFCKKIDNRRRMEVEHFRYGYMFSFWRIYM
ncbi:hypothetical protein AtNW77_Chr3g0185571 [Arabidopsis thaliana]